MSYPPQFADDLNAAAKLWASGKRKDKASAFDSLAKRWSISKSWAATLVRRQARGNALWDAAIADGLIREPAVRS